MAVRGDCPPNTTFVTLLSGHRYLLPAMCLPHQFRIVGSRCPLTLVVDDTTESKLDELRITMLKDAYRSPHSVLRLSTLMNSAGPPRHGRRLFVSTEKVRTHLKVWLWSLKVRRAVYVDLDMLILKNLDDLLHDEGGQGEPIEAVTCGRAGRRSLYNTGIFAYQPSQEVLDALLRLLRFLGPPWNANVPPHHAPWLAICSPPDDPMAWQRLVPNATRWMRQDGSFCQTASEAADCLEAHDGSDRRLMACRRRAHGLPMRRINHACERGYGDQSLINDVLPRYKPLPDMYNVDARHPVNGTPATLHFIGEPKPWEKTPSDPSLMRLARGHARHAAGAVFQARCGGIWSTVIGDVR